MPNEAKNPSTQGFGSARSGLYSSGFRITKSLSLYPVSGNIIAITKPGSWGPHFSESRLWFMEVDPLPPSARELRGLGTSHNPSSPIMTSSSGHALHTFARRRTRMFLNEAGLYTGKMEQKCSACALVGDLVRGPHQNRTV